MALKLKRPAAAAGQKRPIDLDDDSPKESTIELDAGVPEVSFVPGALIRLHGLGKSPQLNGQVCTVTNYIPEKQRYQVRLYNAAASDSYKAVHLHNMAALPAVEEVSLLREELENELKQKIPAVSVVRSVLSRLETLPTSKGLMAETRVPKVVKEVEKRFAFTSQTDITSKSKALIKRWRAVFKASQAADGTDTTCPSAPENAVPAEIAAPAARGAGATGPSAAENAAPAAHSLGKVAVEFDQVQVKGHMTPMQRDEAEQFVDDMRKASTNRMRMASLKVFDVTEPGNVDAFVAAGGLSVLDEWMKSSQELRLLCISSLHEMLVANKDILDTCQSKLSSTIAHIARSDSDPAAQQKARSIFNTFNQIRAHNRLATTEAEASASSAANVPERKRMRVAEPMVQSFSSAHSTTGHASMSAKQHARANTASNVVQAAAAGHSSASSSSTVASAQSDGKQARIAESNAPNTVLPKGTSSHSSSKQVQAPKNKSTTTTVHAASSQQIKGPQGAARTAGGTREVCKSLSAASAASEVAAPSKQNTAALAKAPAVAKTAVTHTPLGESLLKMAPAQAARPAHPIANKTSPEPEQLHERGAQTAHGGTRLADLRSALEAVHSQAAPSVAAQAVTPAPSAAAQPVSPVAPNTVRKAPSAAPAPAPSAPLAATAKVVHAAAVGKVEEATSVAARSSPSKAAPQLPPTSSFDKLLSTVPPSADPRVLEKFRSNPKLVEFLGLHLNVMQNLNADGIAFLVRRLEKSRDTNAELRQSNVIDANALDEEARSVVIGNLHHKVQETEVQGMLRDVGCVARRVVIPRESRRKQSVGIAFAVLAKREDAERAVDRLDGHINLGREISVGHVNARENQGRPPRKRKIAWKEEEKLWDVAVFRSDVPVSQMGRSMIKPEKEKAFVDAAGRQNFQAAASRERAAEREALYNQRRSDDES